MDINLQENNYAEGKSVKVKRYIQAVWFVGEKFKITGIQKAKTNSTWEQLLTEKLWLYVTLQILL